MTISKRPAKARFKGQLQSYAVGPDVAAYLGSRYDGSWSCVARREIRDAGEALLMDDFRPGIGCCSITALTYVFDYYRRVNLMRTIPADLPELFAAVEAQAIHHGYSLAKGRTNPLRIGSIVRKTWRQFNMRGFGHSVLFPTAASLIQMIDNNQPALLNIAFGFYRRHTVALVGYQIWQSTGSGRPRNRLFLKVFDGWSRSERLIDFTAITRPCSRDFSFFSLTKIRPDGVWLS